MARSVGRPRKYQDILDCLEEDAFYSPAVIVRFAQEQGLIKKYVSGDDTEAVVMKRLRIALIRLCHLHQFPIEGDGQIRIKGQAPVSAWFGWRWKGRVKRSED